MGYESCLALETGTLGGVAPFCGADSQGALALRALGHWSTDDPLQLAFRIDH